MHGRLHTTNTKHPWYRLLRYGTQAIYASMIAFAIMGQNFMIAIGLMAISFVGGAFIKLSICLLGACKGVSKLFGINNYRSTVIPITILMLILSCIIYDDINEMFEWAFSTWAYYAFPFQFILPLIIWITAKFKKKVAT